MGAASHNPASVYVNLAAITDMDIPESGHIISPVLSPPVFPLSDVRNTTSHIPVPPDSMYVYPKLGDFQENTSVIQKSYHNPSSGSTLLSAPEISSIIF